MAVITARVRSHIRLQGPLRPSQISALQARLTISNPDKDRAVREHVQGAHLLPDTLDLWKETEDGYLLPRGIGDELDEILSADIEWIDDRVSIPVSTSLWRNPILRTAQAESVAAIRACAQGVLQAPPGFGKTVTMLEAIRQIGQRALIIVDKTNIAEQWRQRAAEHLGLTDVGLVGDGEWTEHDLTIALQPTLWTRRNSLAGWWETWGLVCLDECHHVSAETFYDIIQRFPAMHRIGLSATPKKQKGREELVRCAIGPIVNKVEESMTGEVYIRETEFTHSFWPTHRGKKDKETKVMTCEYRDRGCELTGLTHRNNYSALIASLIEDDARNDLIANDIVSDYTAGRTILVLSRRLKHLENIARRVVAMIGPENVYRLSGKEKTEERMATQERAGEGHIVIFSTIGDEAMDIPRLDTLVLPFPTKNEGLLEQQVGRIARDHPEKFTPIVRDYRDRVGVSRTQLKARVGVYRKRGLIVKTALT
jgi:superfamily II DNA or RNA helicase